MANKLLQIIGLTIVVAAPCRAGWALFSGQHVHQVICANSGQVFAVSADNDVLTGTRGDWQIIRVAPSPVRHVSGATPDRALAVGDSGLAGRLAGNIWTPLELGLSEDLQLGVIDHEDGVWLAGDNFYHYADGHVEQLEYSDVSSLEVDGEGRVWISSDEAFGYFEQRAFHDAPRMDRFVIGHDGNIYAADGNYRFCVWQDSAWQEFAVVPPSAITVRGQVSLFTFAVLEGNRLWLYYIDILAPPRSPAYTWHWLVKVEGGEIHATEIDFHINTIVNAAGAALLVSSDCFYWETGDNLEREVPLSTNMNWMDDSYYMPYSALFTSSGQIWNSYMRASTVYEAELATWRIDWPWHCSTRLNLVLNSLIELNSGELLAIGSDQGQAFAQEKNLFRYSTGSGWRADPLGLPESAAMIAIAGRSDSLFWTAGAGVFRCEGGAWQQELAAPDDGALFSNLLLLPSGGVFGCGNHGLLARRWPDGTWETWRTGPWIEYLDLAWSEQDSKVWVVGTDYGLPDGYAGCITTWSEDEGTGAVILPWSSGVLSSVEIDSSNLAHITGYDPYVYDQTAGGWTRTYIIREWKWLGQLYGALFMMDGNQSLWTNLDLFAPLAGGVRMGFEPMQTIYCGGDEFRWTINATCDDGLEHLTLHAFLLIEDEFYFYPDWNSDNSGAPVTVTPDQPLEFELVRAALPSDLPRLAASVWAYLADAEGNVAGNIVHWSFALAR